MSETVHGDIDSSLMNAINAMGGVPSSTTANIDEQISYISVFKRDRRLEFRGIYDSIIDSTLAGMY